MCFIQYHYHLILLDLCNSIFRVQGNQNLTSLKQIFEVLDNYKAIITTWRLNYDHSISLYTIKM
jgi:hypothetical protein